MSNDGLNCKNERQPTEHVICFGCRRVIQAQDCNCVDTGLDSCILCDECTERVWKMIRRLDAPHGHSPLDTNDWKE